MKSIRILHITDLHCPDKETTIGEVKQKDIQNLTPIIIDTWLENFVKTILRWANSNNKIDIMAFTGDLGNKGKRSTIQEGVALLKTLCDKLNIEQRNVILCPGNHDLEREKGKNAFDTFNGCVEEAGFANFCKNDNVCHFNAITGISIYAINSCLATQESLFVEKYRKLIESLTDEDKQSFKEEAQQLKQEYLEDYLDIPAITKKQRDNLELLIQKNNGDSAIVLVHHNLFHNKLIECRPYSNVVDGGLTLDSLNTTGKNIFVIHGHIHFSDSTLAFFPHKENNAKFISSLGSGCLNGNNGATASILEFFFTDDNNHIITNIYPFINEGGGFNLKNKFNIYDKLTLSQLRINYESLLREENNIKFEDMQAKLNPQPLDDDLLKVLLRDRNVLISRNNESNFHNWSFSYK